MVWPVARLQVEVYLTNPAAGHAQLVREACGELRKAAAEVLEMIQESTEAEAAELAQYWQVRSFKEVLEAADTSMEAFADVVRTVKERHKHQVKRLTVGMKDLKSLRMQAGASEAEVIEEIDKFLDRFVLSRIGIEMLNSQYLSMFSQNSGIADPHCDPCANASEEVPPIVIRVASDDSQVVPGALETGTVVPPDCTVASLRLQEKVWSYMYSTRRTATASFPGSPTTVPSDVAEAPSGGKFATPLAGFGVGLPLSRLYAECALYAVVIWGQGLVVAAYIGGSLQLVSMPLGCARGARHAFLFLERCSSRKEGMPTYVNWLRKLGAQRSPGVTPVPRRHLLEELLDLEGRKRLLEQNGKMWAAGAGVRLQQAQQCGLHQPEPPWLKPLLDA
eukprot:Skav233907  [mRNA]  locus=scaffold435:390654:407696:+ [translate_table: standard]